MHDEITAADTFTANMVWDDKLQNIRPMTDAEIAQRDADKQAAADTEAQKRAFLDALSTAAISGADPATAFAQASQAAVAVASPAVKVKP